MQRAVNGERASEVPCGDCTSCCRSSQFIHIEPDEATTLARIPAAHLFAAPRLPKGHVVMGFDANGCCPMLSDDRCSIYEDRPKTCRTYDCRIFPAAGIDPGDDHDLISQQSRRWRFEYPTTLDRAQHVAVRAAAAFIEDRPELFGDGPAPTTPTQKAALALGIFDAFLGSDASNGVHDESPPELGAVRAAVACHRERDH